MAEGFITRRGTPPEPVTFIDASAVAFIDTYLLVQNNTSVQFPLLTSNTNNFEFELDIEFTRLTSSSYNILFNGQGGSGANNGIILSKNPSNFFQVTVSDKAAYSSNFSVFANQKYNIKFGINNGTVFINVNGTNQNLASNTTFTPTTNTRINETSTGDYKLSYLAVFESSVKTHEFLFEEGTGTTLNDNVGIKDGTITNPTWLDESVETLTYEESGKFYKSHTFKSSGTFTVNSLSNDPTKNDVDYLIIAGGAGGGNSHGGGGGAGGYRTTNGTSGANSTAESKVTVTAQSYTVTIGGGGNGGASGETEPGQNGTNSSALGITSTGGGGGGGAITANPDALSGGSGGGVAVTTGSVGSGTANQGFDGGTAVGSPSWAGGGGGGASQVGGNASANVGGNGGNGLDNTLRDGTSETRAGGGGGGTENSTSTGGIGGTGGGGNGGRGGATSQATSGTANTGSGGGGGPNFAFSNGGGNGGSGIVIIRYEVGGL